MTEMERIRRMEEKIDNLNDMVVEHRTRLDNGVHAFRDQNERIAKIEVRTQPRAPAVWRIASTVFVFVLAAVSGLWTLSDIIADLRHDLAQVEAHNAKEISGLREQVARQSSIGERFEAWSEEQDQRFERLLKSLEESPKRRRRR